MRAGAWYQCGFLPDGRAGSDAGDARLVPCPAPVASARDAFDGDGGSPSRASTRTTRPAGDCTRGASARATTSWRNHPRHPRARATTSSPRVSSTRRRTRARTQDPSPRVGRTSSSSSTARWRHGRRRARVLGWRRSSRETPTPTPRDVHLPRRVRALTAGERHTLAVCEDGSAWAWGDDACGQLGATRTRRDDPAAEPPATAAAAEPPATITFASRVALPPGVHVVAACAGARHSVVVDARGAAYAFGWGLHGQLGLGDGEDARAPTRVASLDGIFIARAAAGTAHTVLLTHHGTAYAFGSNHHGQLGVPEETCPPGSATAEPVMVEIRGDPNDKVEFADVRSRRARREGVATPPDVFDGVSCGSRHTAAVSKDGTIRAWGWNARGQLGTGDRIDRSTPTAVEIPGGRRAARVACGWWHTLVEVVDEDEG